MSHCNGTLLVTLVFPFSSKMENTGTGNVLPNRRFSQPKADALDSRYFTASPVNVDYSANTFSGSDWYVKYEV